MGEDVETTQSSNHGGYTKHPEVAIPGYIGRSLTSFLVFVMAATMRG